MPKFVIVYSTTATLIDASDEEKAIVQYANKNLALPTYSGMQGKREGSLYKRKITVHELDDGEEYEVEGSSSVTFNKTST